MSDVERSAVAWEALEGAAADPVKVSQDPELLRFAVAKAVGQAEVWLYSGQVEPVVRLSELARIVADLRTVLGLEPLFCGPIGAGSLKGGGSL